MLGWCVLGVCAGLPQQPRLGMCSFCFWVRVLGRPSVFCRGRSVPRWPAGEHAASFCAPATFEALDGVCRVTVSPTARLPGENWG